MRSVKVSASNRIYLEQYNSLRIDAIDQNISHSHAPPADGAPIAVAIGPGNSLPQNPVPGDLYYQSDDGRFNMCFSNGVWTSSLFINQTGIGILKSPQTALDVLGNVVMPTTQILGYSGNITITADSVIARTSQSGVGVRWSVDTGTGAASYPRIDIMSSNGLYNTSSDPLNTYCSVAIGTTTVSNLNRLTVAGNIFFRTSSNIQLIMANSTNRPTRLGLFAATGNTVVVDWRNYVKNWSGAEVPILRVDTSNTNNIVFQPYNESGYEAIAIISTPSSYTKFYVGGTPSYTAAFAVFGEFQIYGPEYLGNGELNMEYNVSGANINLRGGLTTDFSSTMWNVQFRPMRNSSNIRFDIGYISNNRVSFRTEGGSVVQPWLAIGTNARYGTYALTLVNNGNPAYADAWLVFSSKEHKEDIQPLSEVMPLIKKINGYRGRVKGESQERMFLLADELLELPYVVRDNMAISTTSLIGYLIKALQELSDRLDRLSNKRL